MIITLKRDDLPQEHRDLAVEGLELDRFQLPSELVDRAELIVFVEGDDIKFLKHREDIQSKDSAYVLFSHIISTPPITKARPPFSLKRFGQRRNKE